MTKTASLSAVPEGHAPEGKYPHLFPDGVVAEEAAHLTLGQCAARVRVLVAREQVHTQVLKDAAVEGPTRHKQKWVTVTVVTF